MAYEFIIGEQREVGGTFTANNGSDFSITATYEHLLHDGIEVSSGTAIVDGHKVYALIQPPIGLYQKVVFTCIMTPLTSGGTPDYEKNIQTEIETCTVNCKSK